MGCQYISHEFQQLFKAHQITVSMSGTGNCYDNAAMESFFHMNKRNKVSLNISKFSINRQRLHSTLGYVTPSDFEAKEPAP